MRASGGLFIKWYNLQLRQQLMIAFVAFSCLTLFVFLVFSGLYNHNILSRRAIDLLHSRNSSAVSIFNLKVHELWHNAASCEPGDAQFYNSLVKSPHFLNSKTNVGSAPKEAITFSPAGSEFSIHLECFPKKGEWTTVALSSRWFSQFFVDRIGLGESGETYLMKSNGVLLTESRFTKSTERSPIPIKLTESWTGLKKDYRGVPVFAVWQRVEAGSFMGIIASEIDSAEVFAPASDMLFYSIIFMGVISVLIILAAPALSRHLSSSAEEKQRWQQLRSLALIEGEEKERRRIGLELHDDIGQELTALKWNLSGLSEASGDGGSSSEEHVDCIVDKVRALSSGLLAAAIEKEGVIHSIKRLINEFQKLPAAKKLKIELQVFSAGEPPALAEKYSVGIYRIVQEGLNNILKHSKATLARVTLNISEDAIRLVIEDNGQVNKKIEVPRTISIRCESLGGKTEFKSSPLGGFMIDAIFSGKESL
jgi:signal transduction histidine kinase